MEIKQVMTNCKDCGQPVKDNHMFYKRVLDKFGKSWQSLSKEDQGNALSELRKEGIFPTLNMDDSAHICGINKKFFEEIVKKLEPYIKQIIKETISEISNSINKRIYKLEKHIDESENSLSSIIQFEINESKK